MQNDIMGLKDKNTALLMIDLQKGFGDEEYWGGNRNNKDAEEKCLTLLNTWRKHQLPVFHIIHSSKNPESKLHASHPGYEIIDSLKPIEGEALIVKQVNSAFIGTNLKEQLDNKHITTLVIVGLTTNHCISTSTRMAGNFGYNTYLISDATATFDRVGINGEIFSSELIHQSSLASLNDEFAKVLTSNQLIELL